MSTKVSWFKPYNLEITSLSREEFDYESWRKESLEKFSEIGFLDPEEEFKKRQLDQNATFWHPENQDKPVVFFIDIHAEGDEKFLGLGDIMESQIQKDFKKSDGSQDTNTQV